jgi:hypothetical protein
MVTPARVSTRSPAVRTVTYSVLGIPIAFTSDVEEALERIHDSYGSFESGAEPDPLSIELLRLPDGEGCSVRDSGGYERSWPQAEAAIVDVLNRLTALMFGTLHERRRVLAVHAAALVHRDGALIVAGKSGAGKTTVALGLVRRGLGLLSDELAVLETETGVVLPYRRSLHVRPQTVDLVPELGFLEERPRHQLGGGIEWALSQDELGQVLSAAAAVAAPLRAVLLLDGTPDPGRSGILTPLPPAVAALELLRSTWKASIDFEGTMATIVRLVSQARCGRLAVGELESTLDAVTGWLEDGSDD